MSIRPIDLQVMVHRSAESPRLTNNSERSEVNYQQFADQLKKEVNLKDQHVNELNKSEQNMVDKDGKGNAGNQSSKKREKKAPKKNDDQQNNNSTSMFDIKV